MKLVYKDMGHIICFEKGYINELVIENKPMFFNMVNSMALQCEGVHGDCVLSVGDKPVEFCKYADFTVRFTPFNLNRKSLLTKLCSEIEKQALLPENYVKTCELLTEIEKHMLTLTEELPFEINCRNASIGHIIRALSPEIDESEKTPLEKIFAYMELVRELERDKLFIMVNMRTYFSNEEMEFFAESAVLHDFKVLLLENFESPLLKYVKRFTVDNDLCEF